MSDSNPQELGHPDYAFLDANVIRGQLTTDLLLTLAEHELLEPFWSQDVIDEMRRNRPPGLPVEKIDCRVNMMNAYFPDAMISRYGHLTPDMQVDPKDRHVLAAAVHGRCDVLVTDNVKDFAAPSSGPFAMRVEKLSAFLTRKLAERTSDTVRALQSMVGRNRSEPRTLNALIDKMATMPELREFAQALNEQVVPEDRGSHEALGPDRQASIQTSAAFRGIAAADGAVSHTPRTSQRLSAL